MIGIEFDRPILLLAVPIALLAVLAIDGMWGLTLGAAQLSTARDRLRPRSSQPLGRRAAPISTRAPRPPSQRAKEQALSLRPRRGRRATLALAIRLLVVALVALALAGPRFDTAIQREAVVFDADLSASVKDQIPTEAAWIQQSLAARRPGDLAGIVVTGRDPLAELAVSADPRFTAFQSIADGNWTNLAGSLSLAAAMLPDDARRRVVLLSDGQENIGDAVQQARLLHAEGVVVDTVPVASPNGPEIRVDSVSAPSTIGRGERYSLTIRVISNVAESATLRVFLDGAPVGSQAVTVQPGTQQFDLPETAPSEGTHRVRVELDPTADSVTQNNVGQAVVQVIGPPRVVVAEGTAGDGNNVASALQANGFQVTTISASSLPVSAEGLADNAAIVLVDVPARELGSERMAAIQTYVRDLGHGLLVIGGEDSYGLGAYADTPLEQALPVTMEIPQRKEIPTVAVALVVENLENSTGNDTAKEAAKKVVEQLTPRDEVMVSDAASGFPVPLQHVTDPATIEKTIDAMQTGDPASYAPYLAGAANALIGSDAQVKHVILVGDGDAQDDYQPLIEQIVARGITVSAVATAAHDFADAPTMQSIARWGHGRYYEATDFDVPQALLQEAHTVIRPAMIQDHFAPQTIGSSSLLAGLAALPPLDGYVATTPRPIASVALVSDQGDPILASWQYGLGRSVAWTSDANGLWTRNLIEWAGAGQFWAQLLAWVLPPAGDPNWHLAITQAGPTAEIVAETDQLGESPPTVTARVVGPDNTTTAVPLAAVAPGKYQAAYPVGAPGAYTVHVSGAAGQQPRALDGALVVPYSPEYRAAGVDETVLKQVARAGGGKILDSPSQAFADDLPAASGGAPLWDLLLEAAAILLVVDVAVRRLNVSGRDLEPALKPVRHLVEVAPWARTDRSSSKRAAGHLASTPESGIFSRAVPSPTQEPDPTTKEDPLHTTRLLAARRGRAGRRERPSR
ncbi:MAG TPA: glutamine amidotransferase [Chloroflexota bacterium]|nr:glutamine amidotransferase [Chloroflexota bacterium]